VRKFLDRLITGLAIAFVIPTALILISWNAIPGGRFYPIKAEMEDITLALTANTRFASTFSLEFTNRRFNEATLLLAKEGSTIGYELLVAEAQQTQAIILDKQDVKNGSQLIEKIEEYQAEIEKKQIEIQSQAGIPTIPIPLVVKKPIITTIPSGEIKEIIVSKPVIVVIREEEPEEVLEKLEEAQEELEEIKEKIKKDLPDAASEKAKEKQQENQEKKEEREKEH
jgi:prephenate dehydrogenase